MHKMEMEMDSIFSFSMIDSAEKHEETTKTASKDFLESMGIHENDLETEHVLEVHGEQMQVPSTPFDIQVLNVGPTTAKLRWKTRNIGAGVVVRHHFYIHNLITKDISEHVMRKVNSTPSIEYTLTNLKVSTNYKVFIAAKNDCFLGEKSKAIDFRTIAPYEPPPPVQLTCTKCSHEKVCLTWVSDYDNGSTILEYEVQLSTDGFSWPHRKKHTHEGLLSNPQVSNFDGLESNTVYYARVRSRNKLGFGKQGRLIEIRTKAPQVPSIIQSLEVVDIGQETLKVKWEPPISDNGAEIIYYHLQISVHTKKFKFSWSSIAYVVVQAKSRTHTFSNLQNDTLYRIRIRSMNRVGCSKYSENLETRTKCHEVGMDVEVFVEGSLFSNEQWYEAVVVEQKSSFSEEYLVQLKHDMQSPISVPETHVRSPTNGKDLVNELIRELDI